MDGPDGAPVGGLIDVGAATSPPLWEMDVREVAAEEDGGGGGGGGGGAATTIMVGLITCRPAAAAAVVKYWLPMMGKDPDLSKPTWNE